MDRNSIKLSIQPEVMDKANSSSVADAPNKMMISFPLLRTYPIVNANGDTFDYESTKELFNTIEFGYINLEHKGWINIGTVTSSRFEEGDVGVIKCDAIIWKNALAEYGISEQDIRDGKYQISMEVFFNDYYIMHGNQKIERPEAREFVEDRGKKVDGKAVSRVIIPTEYSGAALVENAADKTLDIEKVVAKKLEDDKLAQNSNPKKGDNKTMAYKEFETEEEFNNFLSEKEKEIASQLREDEEFIADMTEGLVSYDEVIAKFEESGFEDIEDLEEVIARVNGIKEDFEEFKQEVAREKKLNERKNTLEEKGIDIEKLEANEEDIVELGDKAFELLIRSFEQASEAAKKAMASQNDSDDNDDNGNFDPTNASTGESKKDTKDLIASL